MSGIISIVTVCLNIESEIEKTMRSVLGQDYHKIEYIIKDGGSTDKTNEIIRSFQPFFEHKGILLKHIISGDDGIYDAMNIAVENCSGDWVVFMNSGDLFYNDTVLSDVFEDKDWSHSDVIYGHTLIRITEKRGYIVNHSDLFLEEGMSLCHQSLFVRRELLLKFPFDCHYKIKADYEQMLRLKMNGCIFTGINTIIADRKKSGISNERVALCNKEDNMLKIQYHLPWKNKLIFLGYIKEIAKRVAPGLTNFWSVYRREKNIVKYKPR